MPSVNVERLMYKIIRNNMTQTKFFRWALLLCLSGAISPLAAQVVGEKAKKVEQMQVLKTDGKVLRITVDGAL